MNELYPRAAHRRGSTPMMAQYLEIKAAHAGLSSVLPDGRFLRAVLRRCRKAAEALDIALTKRGKHLGEDIPMCGVPVHAAEHYLEKLIRKGFRVAVCEQVEDPGRGEKRGPNPWSREVVRLVTPGTLTEDSLLEPRAPTFSRRLGVAGGDFALASADMSAGEFSRGGECAGRSRGRTGTARARANCSRRTGCWRMRASRRC